MRRRGGGCDGRAQGGRGRGADRRAGPAAVAAARVFQGSARGGGSRRRGSAMSGCARWAHRRKGGRPTISANGTDSGASSRRSSRPPRPSCAEQAGAIAAVSASLPVMLRGRPHICHRSRVADMLAARHGFDVRHLAVDQLGDTMRRQQQRAKIAMLLFTAAFRRRPAGGALAPSPRSWPAPLSVTSRFSRRPPQRYRLWRDAVASQLLLRPALPQPQLLHHCPFPWSSAICRPI